MTPVLLPAGTDLQALHRLAPERYSFLLESTAAGTSLGGFDVLMMPSGESLVLQSPGRLSGPAADEQEEFLAALDAWWRSIALRPEPATWPFTGGWFLYLGYELAAEIEPGLQLQADPLLPTAFAARCDAAVIRDNKSGRCHFIAEPGSAFSSDDVLSDIAACADLEDLPGATTRLRVTEEDPDIFLRAVRKAKDYIAAGDIYQANLSRGWSVSSGGRHAAEIYESLCRANPGPFAGMFYRDGVSVVSSSPERLLSIKDGHASTRPIAGTRPRSEDMARDRQLLEELISDPKERAEHVMLIDLERNDLGRICEAGSVKVDEMMIVESYAHVHHIVSNVRGRLREAVTPGEAIAAVFPGGTITGCPKVRCMEIISELESGARGAYTGSFGYLNRNGSLDLNILIRTLVVTDDTITFRAGSGIVADSEPLAELNETRAKAEGLIRALDG